MELFETLRKILEYNASRLGIVIDPIFSFPAAFKNSWIGSLIDQHVNNNWVIISYLSFFSHFFHSLFDSCYLDVELELSLSLVEPFSIDN